MNVQQQKELEIEKLFPYKVTKKEFVSNSKPDVTVVYPDKYKSVFELNDEERFELAGLSPAWNRIKESIKEKIKQELTIKQILNGEN